MPAGSLMIARHSILGERFVVLAQGEWTVNMMATVLQVTRVPTWIFYNIKKLRVDVFMTWGIAWGQAGMHRHSHFKTPSEDCVG